MAVEARTVIDGTPQAVKRCFVHTQNMGRQLFAIDAFQYAGKGDQGLESY